MSITIEREKLERMLMLLAVATFHTPSLQAQRTELVEAGLKALTAPVQEPVSDDEITAWAERHDIQGTQTDLRCMFEDAASFTAQPAAPVQKEN